MADKIDDGGPAYPAPAEPRTDWSLEDVTSGMSLRDHFASQALINFSNFVSVSVPSTFDVVAKYSYIMADAMLKARKARKGGL